MEYEDKFLDENYIRTRMNDFKDIRNGRVGFRIKHSDRPYSRTLYVEFYVNQNKRAELRISDHSVDTVHTQFVVSPTSILTKKVKERFVRLVDKSIQKAMFKSVMRKISYMEKQEK